MPAPSAFNDDPPGQNPATPAKSNHLQRLESESIHILREVVAELENPVLLYSIGKDSSVILHLALKAFHPGKPPFPLLHVDSTWEFGEMIEFRENYARRQLGLNVIAYVNREGVEAGINPFDHGSSIYTDVMRTQPLKQALTEYGFDGAIGGGRRDEERIRDRVPQAIGEPLDGHAEQAASQAGVRSQSGSNGILHRRSIGADSSASRSRFEQNRDIWLCWFLRLADRVCRAWRDRRKFTGSRIDLSPVQSPRRNRFQ